MTTTFQVRTFDKIAARHSRRTAQMYKMRTRSKLLRQFTRIVMLACAERTGTESQAIVRIVYSIQEPSNILFIGHDTRQAQNLERRVIGMHTHIHAVFFAYRHNGSQEITHVLTQRSTVDSVIQCQQVAENSHRILVAFLDISVYESLCLHDNRINQFVFLGFGNHFIQFSHLAQFFFRIVRLSTFAFQNHRIEISETYAVEIQRTGTVCPRMLQVGTHPVDDRHKIITYRLHAAFAQIGKAHLIVLNQLVAFRTGILDSLAHRQAFHYRPSQPVRFDVRLQAINSLLGPYITIGHFMKCGHNTFYADLAQHGKCNLIFLPKPSPSFFHHIYEFLSF